jgi:hypothetical protein
MPTRRNHPRRTDTGRAAHTTLRYFPFNDELYFMRDDEAREFVAMHNAAKWGDFRRGAPGLYASALARFEGCDDELDERGLPLVTADDHPFDMCDVPGFEDGDWPLYPAFSALRWMPSHIIEACGEVVESVLNGPMLCIWKDREAEIVAALEAEGYLCVRDEELGRQIG